MKRFFSFTIHPSPSTIALAVLLLAGCASLRKPNQAFVSSEFSQRTPRNVAVLIFDNTSLDLLAPDMLRGMVRENLMMRGYQSPPLKDVDTGLHDIGVSDGGQLRAIKAMELGKQLDVDGLLFGVIEEFQHADIGFGVRRAVRLKLTLLRADDGEKLWEHEVGEAKLDVRDKAEIENGILANTVERAKQNIRKRPLYEQSRVVVDRLLLTLPTR